MVPCGADATCGLQIRKLKVDEDLVEEEVGDVDDVRHVWVRLVRRWLPTFRENGGPDVK
jgi:hypothetical protein